MTIINPSLSFLQFGAPAESDCLEDVNACLPVMEVSDLKFQICATTETVSQASGIVSSNASLVLSVVGLDGTVLKNYSTDGYYFERYKTADKKVLLYWPHGLPGIAALVDCDTCFK